MVAFFISAHKILIGLPSIIQILIFINSHRQRRLPVSLCKSNSISRHFSMVFWLRLAKWENDRERERGEEGVSVLLIYIISFFTYFTRIRIWSEVKTIKTLLLHRLHLMLLAIYACSFVWLTAGTGSWTDWQPESRADSDSQCQLVALLPLGRDSSIPFQRHTRAYRFSINASHLFRPPSRAHTRSQSI